MVLASDPPLCPLATTCPDPSQPRVSGPVPLRPDPSSQPLHPTSPAPSLAGPGLLPRGPRIPTAAGPTAAAGERGGPPANVGARVPGAEQVAEQRPRAPRGAKHEGRRPHVDHIRFRQSTTRRAPNRRGGRGGEGGLGEAPEGGGGSRAGARPVVDTWRVVSASRRPEPTGPAPAAKNRSPAVRRRPVPPLRVTAKNRFLSGFLLCAGTILRSIRVTPG